MKKVITLFTLLIEFIGIFAICIITSMNYADHCGTEIIIPDGLQLTLNNDVSLSSNNGTVLISKDTVVVPDGIHDNLVFFYHDSSTGRLHTSWENFKERQVLEDLQDDAEQRRVESQKSMKIRGVIFGVVLGLFWFILGCFVFFALLKKEKGILVVIINVLVIIAIAIYLYKLNAYLWL